MGVKSYGYFGPKDIVFFAGRTRNKGKVCIVGNFVPLIKGNFENLCRVISKHVPYQIFKD